MFILEIVNVMKAIANQSVDTDSNNYSKAEVGSLKDIQSELEKTAKQGEQLRANKGEAEGAKSAHEGKAATLVGEIRGLVGEIQGLQGKLKNAKKEDVEGIQNQIAQKQEEINQKINELQSENQNIAEQIKVILDIDGDVDGVNAKIGLLREKLNEEKTKAENKKKENGIGKGIKNKGLGDGIGQGPGRGQGPGGGQGVGGGFQGGGVGQRPNNGQAAGAAAAGLNKPAFGSSYIESAKSLLRAVLSLMVTGAGNNNPFCNIAKMLAGKSMVEVAKTLTEAGMTDEVVNGNPMLRHEALLVDTQAAGLRGIFETAIQYWNQTAQANKQIEKDTHQLATRS